MDEIKEQLMEYRLYLQGRSGGFTTNLYNAISKADPKNQAKLAKGYPAHVLVHKMFCDGPYANIYMWYKIDGEPLEGGIYPKDIDSGKKFEIGALLFGSIEKCKHAWCLD